MYLKSNNWLDSWKEFKKAPLKNKKRILLNEASPAFVHGVNKWIDTVTDEGEYALNEVLPWGDMFDGALRVAVPAASEDDANLAKIIKALLYAQWHPNRTGPAGTRSFRLEKVKQKKRRAGTGEVYEEEDLVAKLDLNRIERKQIPKGPRAGEWVVKDEVTTMSRAINKLTKKDPLRRSSERADYIPPELAEWWQKKQTFYTKGGHWEQIEKIFKDPESAGEMKSDQMIVLSRHPIDVLRMGDVETVGSLGTAGKIGHCHREGGEFAHCAQQEALGHGPIAYLVPKKEIDFLLSGATQEERIKNYLEGEGPGEPKYKLSDFDGDEIFNDRDRDIIGIKALNRLRLRQYRDNEINEMWAVPEKQVYPSFDIIPGFQSAVSKWAWDRQKDLYEEAYKPGEFPSFDALERLGGKYGDHRDGQLLNAFFNRSGKYPDYAPQEDVHHEREESEDLEPDPEMIAEEWDSRIQDILETINGRMDHASVYAEVEVLDDTPYVMMSGQLTVEFNEDLFGDDGGAEYELPTGYGDQGYNELTSELGEALRDQAHVYADDVDINDWQNTISFNFNINNEDYDANPEGFDSFADYIESEWDNQYEAIRKVIKRLLIKEEYMGADAYEKLRARHQSAEELADEEGHTGMVYKHWDFDEDGNEITFTLKDPATLVAEPNFHGLYLGSIPVSMDLRYIFHDWGFKSSKEFENKFIPKIRTLFADAETEALKQLNLPGLEAKEMHGLLLPEKAEFRLKQVFDSYENPAHIYLQVKIEIDEDITDAQTEEIEYFLKYLDEDSKIDILEKAAESTFQEFLQPAIKKRVATDKVKKFGETIKPLLRQIPIEQLMNFVGNLPFVNDATVVHSKTHQMASLIMSLAPRAEEGKPSNQFAEELYKRWTLDTLARAADALPPVPEDAWSWTTGRSAEEIEEKMEELYGEANKILGIRLQNSSISPTDPGTLLENLLVAGEELLVTGANQISYIFDMIMKDPKKAGGVEMLKKIMKPDYAPSWYTKELQKAGIASERIVDILPLSALDNPRTQEYEDATDELMKLLGVQESLFDRIDDKLKGLALQEIKTTKLVPRTHRSQEESEREFFGSPLEPSEEVLDSAAEKELLAMTMKRDDKADIIYRALFVVKDPVAWKVYNRFKAQNKNIFGNEKEFLDEYWAGPEAKARGKELFKQAQATKAMLARADDEIPQTESILDRINDKLNEGEKWDAFKTGVQHPIKTAGDVQKWALGEPSDLSAKYLGGTDRAAKTVTPGGSTGQWAEEHDAPPTAPEDLERTWRDMVRGVPIPHDRQLPGDVDYTDPRQRDAWTSLPGPSAEEAADLDWSTRTDGVPWEDIADWKSRYEYEYGVPQKWRGRAAKPQKTWDFEYEDTGGGNFAARAVPTGVTNPMGPEDLVAYKKKWIDAYTGGTAREVWEDKLGAENPTWSPKRIASFYEEKIMPGVVKKLEDAEFRGPLEGSLYGAGGDFLPMRPTRVRDPATGKPRGTGARIRLDPELSPSVQAPVVGHELGHAVDYPAVEGEDTLPSMGDLDGNADALGIASDILRGKGRTGTAPSGPRTTAAEPLVGALPITLSDFQADLIGAAFPSTKGKSRLDPHDERHWEMYANILNARVTSGRKFTPKDIGIMKLAASDQHWTRDAETARKYIKKTFGNPTDMIKAFGKKENLGKSNEEIADILNKIALRQPKAKRQQPDRMVAESIVDRIDEVLK